MRATCEQGTDAALIGPLRRTGSSSIGQVDASYAAYDKHPVDEPDEVGRSASWRRAADRDRTSGAREVWWCGLRSVGDQSSMLSRDAAIPRLRRAVTPHHDHPRASQ